MPLPVETGTPRIDLADWNAMVALVNKLESDLGATSDAPGTEMGYAERTTSDTTTNTSQTAASLLANTITGLTVSVVGEGRPVDIEFYCPAGSSSVVNGAATTVILVNDGVDGTGFGGGLNNGVVARGAVVVVKRWMMLTAGKDYTFQVAKATIGGGTFTWYCSEVGPMYLAVTRR